MSETGASRTLFLPKTAGIELTDGFEQFRRFKPQGVGQPDDVYETDVPFPSLHSAHIVAVKVSQLSELFL